MASIAGVKFGTTCDMLIRRFVTLHFDEIIGFYIDVSAPVYVPNPQVSLYVNDELFATTAATVFIENPNRIIFPSLGGFGFGGFGSGGFGSGGFNVGIMIADLGLAPVDDIEVQYQTTDAFCPKCDLLADDGSVILPDTGAGVGFGARGFGDGGFGST